MHRSIKRQTVCIGVFFSLSLSLSIGKIDFDDDNDDDFVFKFVSFFSFPFYYLKSSMNRHFQCHLKFGEIFIVLCIQHLSEKTRKQK